MNCTALVIKLTYQLVLHLRFDTYTCMLVVMLFVVCQSDLYLSSVVPSSFLSVNLVFRDLTLGTNYLPWTMKITE